VTSGGWSTEGSNYPNWHYFLDGNNPKATSGIATSVLADMPRGD
jgi:hypothetical protein